MSNEMSVPADRHRARTAKRFFKVILEAQQWLTRPGLLLKGCPDE